MFRVLSTTVPDGATREIASHLEFSRPEFNPERIQQIRSFFPELVILDKESPSRDMPRQRSQSGFMASVWLDTIVLVR